MRLKVFIAAACAAALLGSPATAHAGFAGQNGKVAFVSNASGVQEVYTVDPDGSNLERLTFGGGDQPAWSPDGTRIAFVRAGTVWVMNSDGSGQHTLGVSGTNPAWSNDGSRIAIDGVSLMNADGTDLDFLTSGVQPAWSPDGSTILFVRARHDFCVGRPLTRIWGIAPDGTDERQLTHDYAFCDYYNEERSPEWAPSANRYVMTRDDDSGYFDGVALEVLGVGENHGTVFGDYPLSGAGWSPDGTLIAYSPFPGDRIVTISPVAPHPESTLVDIPAASDVDPDWQPLPVNTPSAHVRPKSATHVKATLVPAYRPCTSPNREHGPPLAYDSCAPPQPGSSRLIVGVGDGHAAAARSIGFVRLRVSVGVLGGADDTTAPIRVLMTNVMRVADLAEYTGELLASIRVRITDKEGAVSSTLRDFRVEATVPCVPTESTGVASTCDLATELDALIPGATPEGTRAVWALDQVRVYDGGPDEDADTSAGNTLFAVQGVFLP